MHGAQQVAAGVAARRCAAPRAAGQGQPDAQGEPTGTPLGERPDNQPGGGQAQLQGHCAEAGQGDALDGGRDRRAQHGGNDLGADRRDSFQGQGRYSR